MRELLLLKAAGSALLTFALVVAACVAFIGTLAAGVTLLAAFVILRSGLLGNRRREGAGAADRNGGEKQFERLHTSGIALPFRHGRHDLRARIEANEGGGGFHRHVGNSLPRR